MKKALYLLSEFSDRDFDWLLTAGRRKTVSADDVLIRQGEPIDALYVLLAGTLAVQVGSDRRQIAQLSAGEIVGEMSFIDARPPSATVRAIG
jgi:CRP/FNR family transcriptional regulator, cyclic AMP receptor protein